MAHVARHWDLIEALELSKRVEGVTRNAAAHPVPTRAEFLLYAQTLRLPADLQRDLVDRGHLVAGGGRHFSVLKHSFML
ncbi:hypothetical protein B0H17DRAFT_1096810 [Mycena rosella]|uniref:Uncharacterized protein n=1 Tax=Mycena rosella TaxID=1033263 RepID=A0AAD7CQS0_MYCRO|nr:hypothetical protein B0H17DRAFT_1096810 [Mycena rosella]